jgi:hypothetical protein
MTPEQRAERLRNTFALAIKPGRVIGNDLLDAVCDVVLDALRYQADDERQRCIVLIARHLMYSDERAVSYNEVKDCIEAIQALPAFDPGPPAPPS